MDSHFLNFFLFCPSKSNHDLFAQPLFWGGGHMAGVSEQLGICNLLHSTLSLRGTRVINDPMISCRFNSYSPCLGHSAGWNYLSLGTHSQGGLCEFACKCVCFYSKAGYTVAPKRCVKLTAPIISTVLRHTALALVGVPPRYPSCHCPIA